MIAILSFYGASFFLAILAFPLCFHGLEQHRDRGFTSCKVLGLILVTFLHGSIGRLGLNPWSPPTMGFLLCLVFAGWVLWFVRCRNSVLYWLRHNLILLLKIETGFLVVFLTGLWLAAHNPGLTGTEKLMDFAILKSVFRSDTFPPMDPWFAGKPLNYYWFGHHSTALLCKLASIPPQIGYNLMLAFLLANVFISSCGLFISSRMRLSHSLLGASMVTLAGNVTPLWDLVTLHGNFSFIPWNATRIIPHTITEFPFFSFLVGDLHAHFLLLPSFILFILWLLPDTSNTKEESVAWIKVGVVNLLFLAAILGNPWNIPVLGLVFLVFKLGDVTKLPWWSLVPSLSLWPVLFEVKGHPILIKWVVSQNTSPLGPFFLMWGMPFALVSMYLLYKHGAFELVKRRWYYLLSALPVSLQSLPACIAILLVILLWMTANKGEEKTWHGVAICGLILVVVPEFIYLKDSYGAPYERLNTVFKLHYAAWILLMSASCYAVIRLNAILLKVSPVRGPLLLTLWVMFLFVYPVLAVGERTSSGQESLTLNSFTPLRKTYPMDMELVTWLDGKVQAGDVCLEMPGSSYSWTSRFSALTGCPTVLGWEQHQMLWRPDSRIHERAVDAKLFYESENDVLRKGIIEKYKISWVIIGQLELQASSPFLPSFLDGVLSKKMGHEGSGIYGVDENFTRIDKQ